MSLIPNNAAYIILINDDNGMTITQKRRIVQRSKLVDDLWFLIKPDYSGYNMAEFTAVLEYVAPVSRKYRTEFLIRNDDAYNGYLKYTLPLDTNLTAEAGDIELMLTFLMVDLDENGNSIQRVRKISGTKITIVPISAWSDIIPDSALSALDQRIIKIDAQIKALGESFIPAECNKADDLSYDTVTSELQLLSGGKEIGKKVVINSTGESLKDGIPIVDFSNINNDNLGTSDDEFDVVEF